MKQHIKLGIAVLFGFLLGTTVTVSANNVSDMQLAQVVTYTLTKGVQMGNIISALDNDNDKDVVCLAQLATLDKFRPDISGLNSSMQVKLKIYVHAFRLSMFKSYDYECEWGD